MLNLWRIEYKRHAALLVMLLYRPSEGSVELGEPSPGYDVQPMKLGIEFGLAIICMYEATVYQARALELRVPLYGFMFWG